MWTKRELYELHKVNACLAL
uniref:Uncharacterized protein n=1 Tax=Anguilla anguilla TaxID=7936 RepID=A0A0E9Y2S4_ANGAN